MSLVASSIRIAADLEKVHLAITAPVGIRGWWGDAELDGAELVVRLGSRRISFEIDRSDEHGIGLVCVEDVGRDEGQPDWTRSELFIRAFADGAETYVDLVHAGAAGDHEWPRQLEKLKAYCEASAARG